jgi:decaprenylphospho-beta-D-erythro-pentofuranosid-2-ulose 2-reductase
MKRILVIGATSAIAQHCARLWARDGARLALLARDEVHLAAVAADLDARGAAATARQGFDALAPADFRALLDQAFARWTGFDIVLLAHGTLPDQAACEASPDDAARQFDVNATATIRLATDIAQRLVRQGSGTLAIISSVAGDRARPSNFHYGAAKAAVSAFTDGLRLRLKGTGVNVLTIKPGMVATPMTAALDLPAVLVADPASVARDICRAIERKKGTLYTPWWWRWILLVIRHLPEAALARMKS